MHTNKRLEGMTVLITGGARGMGASHAEVLAQHGARIVIGDILDGIGDEFAEAASGRGLSIRYVHLDVTDEASWADVLTDINGSEGEVNVLVNNAGITGAPGGFEVEDPAAWSKTVAVNQTGSYLGMRAVVPSMRRAGGGSIINISSILGYIGDGEYFAYNATKGALRLMTRSAAVKLAPDNIRVNTVCPGMVRTPMNEAEVDADSYVAATPMKRMADPAEISNAVLFLASGESSFVTGTDLVVDGGYLAL
ncbi:SDR family NAD(P)-dependent oxidoreductase [Paenarthrobacter sp. 2TAF44]|uniref:SDR family NAD(P)-dependent oxidoreductase n=1 Tax=Paenarthrobacter sp. 2TAF44 TaxID=3233018 RepID=UPI003F9E4B3D